MKLDNIRENICNNVGNVAIITHNEGRNKVFEYEGEVIEVYRNIFIIMNNGRKKSFSYHDILTDTTKVCFKRKKDMICK